MMAGLIWCLALSAGWVVMANYTSEPGELLPPPAHWPAASRIPHRAGSSRLVLFIHPRCPCSRATLAELERLLSHQHDTLDICIAFSRPGGVEEGWERTDLWRRAKTIPGVTIFVDDLGLEATRFSALTSGVAVVYDHQDQLVFHGGLTPARGHEGDNLGRTALTAWLAGETSRIQQSPVFGCPLQDHVDSVPESDTACCTN